MTMRLIAATLFSGIGAPETAMPEWHWAWCAEIEKFPCAVLKSRHPESVNLGDVSAHGFAQKAGAVAAPDVLVFGSPCQSFSVAGKRLGLDDPRGNLALVALRIVGELKPSWFVFENVPGLLSLDDGAAFGLFLRTVDELGYFGAWASLDAQYNGVAQRRQRVFFVGNSRDWRHSAAVLFESEGLCGHSPPRRKAGQGIAPTIASRPTGGGGLGTDFDCDGGLIANALHAADGHHAVRRDADNIVALALNAKGGSGRIDGESETFVTGSLNTSIARGTGQGHEADFLISHALRADGFDASEDGTGRGTPLVRVYDDPRRFDARGIHGGGDHGDLHPPLNTVNSQQLIAFSSKDHGADAMDDLSPTLRAGTHDHSHANAGVPPAVTVALRGRNGGATAEIGGEQSTALRSSQGGGDKPHALVAQPLRSNGYNNSDPGMEAKMHIQQGSAVRRLTPRECERLQGFPDDYTLIEYRGKPAADGPRYKALGNSMAVPVMRWILSRIEQVHANHLLR
jgi:DNA (cytosine-5)-methyltransferase 1